MLVQTTRLSDGVPWMGVGLGEHDMPCASHNNSNTSRQPPLYFATIPNIINQIRFHFHDKQVLSTPHAISAFGHDTRTFHFSQIILSPSYTCIGSPKQPPNRQGWLVGPTVHGLPVRSGGWGNTTPPTVLPSVLVLRIPCGIPSCSHRTAT